MSAKTKIVVLRMREVICTGIFAALGILLLVLLLMIFLPEKEGAGGGLANETDTSKEGGNATKGGITTEDGSGIKGDSVTSAASGTLYIPGIYTTELVLGGQSVAIEVIVEADAISSLELGDLSEDVTTLYPLLAPTFETISKQVCETQSLEDVTYTADSKYTSLVIVEAIRSSLDKAKVAAEPAEVPDAADSSDNSSVESQPGS